MPELEDDLVSRKSNPLILKPRRTKLREFKLLVQSHMVS